MQLKKVSIDIETDVIEAIKTTLNDQTTPRFQKNWGEFNKKLGRFGFVTDDFKPLLMTHFNQKKAAIPFSIELKVEDGLTTANEIKTMQTKKDKEVEADLTFLKNIITEEKIDLSESINQSLESSSVDDRVNKDNWFDQYKAFVSSNKDEDLAKAKIIGDVISQNLKISDTTLSSKLQEYKGEKSQENKERIKRFLEAI